MPEVNDSPISREGNATATGSGQVGVNTTGRREGGVKFTAARNLSIILCMAICIGVLLYEMTYTIPTAIEMTYTIPTAMQAKACNDFVRTHPDILESWWNAYGQPIENSTIAGMTVPQEWGTAGRAETP